MTRRTFFHGGVAAAIAASSRPFSADATEPRACEAREIEDSADYRLVKSINRADWMYVHFWQPDDGRCHLIFSNEATAPETDVRLSLPCPHPDPGFHVIGIIPYEISVWPARNRHAGMTIMFSRPTAARVYHHRDRAKEIVVTTRPSPA